MVWYCTYNYWFEQYFSWAYDSAYKNDGIFLLTYVLTLVPSHFESTNVYTYVLTIVRLDLDSTNVYKFVLTIVRTFVSLDYQSNNL